MTNILLSLYIWLLLEDFDGHCHFYTFDAGKHNQITDKDGSNGYLQPCSNSTGHTIKSVT